MKGADLVAALQRQFGDVSALEVSRQLGLTQPALVHWKNAKNLSPSRIAGQMRRLALQRIDGALLVEELCVRLGVGSVLQLANRFGVSHQTVRNWQKRKTYSSRQLSKLVEDAFEASAHHARMTAVRPLVEFCAIEKCATSSGKKFQLFKVASTEGSHPYLEGLKKELEGHYGIYVFFDSRGQAIYAGKARKQSLWKEMQLAFNRKRAVQKIRRVSHPSRRQKYRTSKELTRQIVEESVQLHELAHYFSAYEVADELVNDLESLLVRAFANDLLNVRMEKFGHQRRAR